MKFKVYNYKEVTSTNDVALNFIKNKKIYSGCINTKLQTKGKGSGGKKWVSKEGNLFISLFFNLKSNFPSFNEFSTINPIIIYNVIKELCSEHKISIKWPNDILFNGKKVCGILQELISHKDKKFLIIGVGINIVSYPNIYEKYKATSIFEETHKKFTINELLKLIISSYENFFINLHKYNYTNYKKKAETLALN
tara:strand:+ start:2622 stop:3206 length:585 start_codon:yes stop_codon:yes gene_type:complete